MEMTIGIDFDNTIISYDKLIHKIAVETNLITEDFTKNKKDIRNHIRKLPEGEIEWQKIQALIYGSRINEAELIEGIKDFLKLCKDNNVKVYIISHKTEYSNLYKSGTNFRTSALNWMRENIFSENISEEDVYFTFTQDEKVEKIAELGCTHFIDDLEEVFNSDKFPSGIKKILFDPNQIPENSESLISFGKWEEISDYFKINFDLKKVIKKAIVTGGAGFIGSHMIELLLNKGFEVTAIDNMANGQLDNIEIFKDNPNYKFYKIDLADEFDDSLFDGVDYVFHMAALADIVPSIEEPVKYHQANVTGTLRVLEACRKHGVKKLVYSASSSCYGIPDSYPTPESADIRPEYPYAFTKYIGEQYVLFWSKLYNIPVVSLRYFNVFGTRARTNGTYGAVFKVFLKQKLENKPLTIVGDGTQTRDFTYVTDIAKANLTAAESDLNKEVINIGTGNTQSVNYLAELIGGSTVGIPKRPGEPDSTHAEVTKSKELLNWEPEVSFEDGVKIMLDNIDYWKDAPLWDEESIEEATKSWFKYLGKEE